MEDSKGGPQPRAAGAAASYARVAEREARLAEEALRVSEASYRAIYDAANDAIFIHDIQTGEILDANPRMCEMYGYSLGEILGRRPGAFCSGEPPFTQEEALERFRRAAAGEPQSFEWRVRSKGGDAFWAEVNLKRAAIGGRERVLAVVRDIGARKRAEESLRLSELQHRSTLDSLGDAVHVIDRDFRLVLFNQAFRDWAHALGLELGAEGRTVFEVFPFLPERVRDEYRQVFETGRTLVTEETTRMGDRDVVTETRKIPVLEGERVVRVITVVRDITERRKFERELLNAQKLESIGLLAGGIAHDFNNLLAGVLTNLAAARPRASGDSRLGRALAEAERAALRAKGLTQRLLTFSSGGDPVRQTLPLGPLMHESAELALAGSNVRGFVEVPDGLWPAHADALQIGQVLQNLLINARQAMPDGGVVRLRAENILAGPDHPAHLAPGRFVCLSVADQGVGIPSENLSRIFDPFFTTREGGSGLGLTASYAIVRKHGGGIEVQSEPGVGTTFRVYLPAAEARASQAAPTAAAAPRLGARLLLMDDDVILRRGARRLLHNCGYEVVCARDGAKAIELYTQAQEAGRPFDAVVLDLTVMDGMGGEECVQRLRALDPAVRAIACTGYSEDLAEFRRHGFRAVVRKPFTIEELSEALRALAAPPAP